MGTSDLRDAKQMHLAASDIKLLMSVYGGLLIVGLAYVGHGMFQYTTSPPPLGYAIIYCASMSLVGASMFYVRKLYKALINESYTFLENRPEGRTHSESLKRLGTLFYFLFRPLFGVAFSFLIYSLWRLSLAASGAPEVASTIGLFYTAIALGFVSGFLAGRLLTMFEGYGARRLGGLLGSEE